MVLSLSGFQAEWLNANVFVIFNDPVFGEKKFFSMTHTNITNTVIAVLFIIGAMLVSFSREKNEDEFIAKLRLSSLQWAVALSYLLLLFAFIFVYGTAFLNVMIYNMFTVLIIFIIRFNYILYKNSKTAPDEK
ncbi:MAG: hypothetical protein IPL84_17210 [Chitinophagaceae bacterium]|nr:hypothetical protein [Chitinophagaceae bacterium]